MTAWQPKNYELQILLRSWICIYHSFTAFHLFFWTVQKLLFDNYKLSLVRRNWLTKGLVVTLLFCALDLGWEGHAESFGHYFFRTLSQKRLNGLMLQFCQKKLVQAGLLTFNSWLQHLFLMVNPLTVFLLLEPHPSMSDQNISYCSLARKVARRDFWALQQKIIRLRQLASF